MQLLNYTLHHKEYYGFANLYQHLGLVSNLAHIATWQCVQYILTIISSQHLTIDVYATTNKKSLQATQHRF